MTASRLFGRRAASALQLRLWAALALLAFAPGALAAQVVEDPSNDGDSLHDIGAILVQEHKGVLRISETMPSVVAGVSTAALDAAAGGWSNVIGWSTPGAAWELHEDWLPGGSAGSTITYHVLRNGQEVAAQVGIPLDDQGFSPGPDTQPGNVTDAAGRQTGTNYTLDWSNYQDFLEPGTVLSDFYAYRFLVSDPGGRNKADCLGHKVLDCAPDDARSTATFTIVGQARFQLENLTATASPAAFTAKAGATLHGRLDVANHDPTEHRTLKLHAKLPTGWSLATDPEQLHLPPGAAGAINYTVTVAQDAAPGRVTLNLTLDNGFAVRIVPVEVEVLPVGGKLPAALTLKPVESQALLKRGEQRTLTVRVGNAGEEAGTAALRPGGDAAAWLDPLQPAPVPPGGLDLTLTLRVPSDAAPGNHTLTLALEGDAPLTVPLVVEATHKTPFPALALLVLLPALAVVRRR
jgi:hypothetical protein